jgi:nucleoside permease NupC
VSSIILENCLAVGKFIAIKAFINELVAYKELGATINFRNSILSNQTFYEIYKSGGLPIPSNVTMLWNVNNYNNITVFSCFYFKEKPVIISTYALCSFANFGSVGKAIATLSALCPLKAKVFTKNCLLAMISGSLASYMTASIAG